MAFVLGKGEQVPIDAHFDFYGAPEDPGGTLSTVPPKIRAAPYGCTATGRPNRPSVSVSPLCPRSGHRLTVALVAVVRVAGVQTEEIQQVDEADAQDGHEPGEQVGQ
ncbi:hypothetical protein [Streptomyces sp. B1I3]|uniref:hypothetical protein n=1 Tax=Streptomyces sp. B1I3 TaxID=3042264 RepID=UPI0027864342|nr:hypothetical protein [Streptomyces sp. B1I3]